MIEPQKIGFTLVYTWTHVVNDGEHFVEERCEGNHPWTRYGPMPERTVQPFIAERKQMLQEQANAATKAMIDRLRLDAMMRYPHAVTGREAK